jgi:hypothetical protein
MNEQQILETLMRNPVFKRALKEMMLNDTQLAREIGMAMRVEPVVYVWCAEMHDVRGGIYYHPIIVPGSSAMDLETMMMVNNYIMMASEDQFKAHEFEPMANMFRAVYPRIPVRLIAVPKKTFESLQNYLTILVSSVLVEAEKCFEHFDAISAMTRVDSSMLKMQMLASIFNSMTTVSSCFDRDMNICDSEDHEYDFGNDEECDEYDEEYDEDDYDY